MTAHDGPTHVREADAARRGLLGDATARAALVRLVRDEGRRVLATLVRHTGDLQLAEDAVQDAVVRALAAWPRTGVPPQPRAWLTLTARNRGRWHRPSITEGVILVGEGLRRTPDRPDPYVVQAAIAACHALAPPAADTDWAAVLSWYDVLVAVHDTPVVRLNRAVAVGERHGPGVALAELDALAGLAGYPLWHAARAELLVRLDRRDEARAAFEAALALPMNPAQRAHVAGRLAAVVDEPTPAARDRCADARRTEAVDQGRSR